MNNTFKSENEKESLRTMSCGCEQGEHDMGLPVIGFIPPASPFESPEAIYTTGRYNTTASCCGLELRSQEIDNMMGYLAKNSNRDDRFVNTPNGFITYGASNYHSGRFMQAMSFDSEAINGINHPVSSVLTFTENNGFRHAGLNDSNKIVDLGPVITPTVVGTINQPQAIVIPMSNIEALEIGRELCDAFAKAYHECENKKHECADKNCKKTQEIDFKRIDTLI